MKNSNLFQTRLIAEKGVSYEIINFLINNEDKLKEFNLFLQNTIKGDDMEISTSVVIVDMDFSKNDELILFIADGIDKEFLPEVVDVVSALKEAREDFDDLMLYQN